MFTLPSSFLAILIFKNLPFTIIFTSVGTTRGQGIIRVVVVLVVVVTLILILIYYSIYGYTYT